MSKDENPLTFEEFSKLCNDAGISATPEEMEQDYRVGGAIADVVDNMLTAMEGGETLNLNDEVNALWKETERGKQRELAIRVAAAAIQMAARLHDETGNN